MKQAIFLIVSNGVDGRDKTHIDYAFIDEQERDQFLNNMGTNKNYHRTEDRVVDLDAQRHEALRKLDGLDKLALGIELMRCTECNASKGTIHQRNCGKKGGPVTL